MKRFYCTVCKRMKRVRKYPTSVQQVNSETPSQRIGQCTWHHAGRRADINRPVLAKVGR